MPSFACNAVHASFGDTITPAVASGRAAFNTRRQTTVSGIRNRPRVIQVGNHSVSDAIRTNSAVGACLGHAGDLRLQDTDSVNLLVGAIARKGSSTSFASRIRWAGQAH